MERTCGYEEVLLCDGGELRNLSLEERSEIGIKAIITGISTAAQ